MKIKLPKIKGLNKIFSPSVAYILIIIAVIIVLIQLSFFLYKNLYQAVAQSEEIIILREEVAPDTVNMNKFYSVLEKLNRKKESSSATLIEIRNPFKLNQPAPVPDDLTTPDESSLNINQAPL